MSAARTAPARRLGRPPAVSSAETRERILHVARERFAHTGYASTSNKDIARAADITTGAIYHYFESKSDLYLAVFDEVESVVFDRFRAAVEGVDGGFLDKLALVLEEAVEINREDQSLTDFFVAVPVESQRNEELAGLDRRQGLDAIRFFGELVDEGVRSGEIAAGVDPQQVVNVLMAVSSGLARFSSLVGDAEVHAQTSQLLVAMMRGELFNAPKRRKRSPAGAAPRKGTARTR